MFKIEVKKETIVIEKKYVQGKYARYNIDSKNRVKAVKAEYTEELKNLPWTVQRDLLEFEMTKIRAMIRSD